MKIHDYRICMYMCVYTHRRQFTQSPDRHFRLDPMVTNMICDTSLKFYFSIVPKPQTLNP